MSFFVVVCVGGKARHIKMIGAVTSYSLDIFLIDSPHIILLIKKDCIWVLLSAFCPGESLLSQWRNGVVCVGPNPEG